ncbi:Tryptophan aminotransferase-related protein [Thalictrum thalictroides]|uniref:Tryptophan aminotransferase-related protein n=1 Tax=Thalictrum thalictroides TaxID=46969 RepID=A0A7J6VXA8_THATH|nr:Tryptophan aminotransferase-related protein [Thalictrum thalictroides]
MKDFITISTIGVSKDSQLRAAKILRVVSESCQNIGLGNIENFFSYGRSRMSERWERLRTVVKQNGMFSLPEYPKQFCNFSGEFAEIDPAFAWLESKGKIEDTESFLKILGSFSAI